MLTLLVGVRFPHSSGCSMALFHSISGNDDGEVHKRVRGEGGELGDHDAIPLLP